MRFLVLLIVFLVSGCGRESSPTVSVTQSNQQRIVSTTGNKLALTELNHELGALLFVTVTGKIQNISSDSLSNIQVHIKLHDLDGSQVGSSQARPDAGGFSFRPLPPGATTSFSSFMSTSGTVATLDTDSTKIEMSIDGIFVGFDDRRGNITPTDTTSTPADTTSTPSPATPAGTEYYDRYDFRWSQWGDTKEQVQSNEPGEVSFVWVDGAQDTRIDIGYTSDLFTFADDVEDTVLVAYTLLKNGLVSGNYYFKDSTTTDQLAFIKDSLISRYSDPIDSTVVDSTTVSLTWEKNDSTGVYMAYPTDTNIGTLYYFHYGQVLNNLNAIDYNELPLRPIIPDVE